MSDATAVERVMLEPQRLVTVRQRSLQLRLLHMRVNGSKPTTLVVVGGKVRTQLNSRVVVGNRFVEVSFLRIDPAAVAVGDSSPNRFRIEFDGLVVIGKRSIIVFFLPVDAAAACVCGRQSRVQFDGFVAVIKRSRIVFIFIRVYPTSIGVCAGEFRIEFDGLVAVCKGSV